jgi:hypothetical protein
MSGQRSRVVLAGGTQAGMIAPGSSSRAHMHARAVLPQTAACTLAGRSITRCAQMGSGSGVWSPGESRCHVIIHTAWLHIVARGMSYH